MRACVTQLPSVESQLPSSLAISAIGRPEVRTSSSASRLNSVVNSRRRRDGGCLPCWFCRGAAMGHPPLIDGVLPLGEAHGGLQARSMMLR